MADERKYYVLCQSNCKFESMTKEQILTAIEQAITTGEIKDVDAGFVTTLKEQNTGEGYGIWVGSEAEFNAQMKDKENTICFVYDGLDVYTFAEQAHAEVETLRENTNEKVLYNKPPISSAFKTFQLSEDAKNFNAFLITVSDRYGIDRTMAEDVTVLCYFYNDKKERIYGEKEFIKYNNSGTAIFSDRTTVNLYLDETGTQLFINKSKDGSEAVEKVGDVTYKSNDRETDKQTFNNEIAVVKVVGINRRFV